MNLYIFWAFLPPGSASVHADPDPGGITLCGSGSETLVLTPRSQSSGVSDNKESSSAVSVTPQSQVCEIQFLVFSFKFYDFVDTIFT